MKREEVTRLQLRLGVTPDGILGRDTWRALFAKLGASVGVSVSLARGANVHLAAHDITTPLRIAHFTAQCVHETGGFRWFNEIWGPTPAQLRYEGRRDLGNTQAGDGRLYAGRGMLMLTGRANYTDMANKLGIDLVDHPDLAAMPAISVLIAARFWSDKNLNVSADADSIDIITQAINGGQTGSSDRKMWLAKCKGLLL